MRIPNEQNIHIVSAIHFHIVIIHEVEAKERREIKDTTQNSRLQPELN